ncbi:cytochrome c oxidase subunit II [Fictibacillus enclensis]|uniref:Cytochrome c oxidase subunit 2 n=1 Tax=Fictibacillus enclensis TaxID=1017270 RepID=A0A0V8JE61_9BACL|nr:MULTISPECIES: cytochrome c oxidase subunit II [Fictibacillus]KSU84944.1 cytochrome B [Fictibacillus enclensis]MDM5198734.1 cytochrome c oxidase subunit II [Fictibacillus enclensis]MDM5337936.1 cytochrome c oxidase subunit II [Fictibacillus enclensis]RXY99399.1 cytochrome c oxidase subunit II [Fictibacillus sp. S7]
MRKLLRKGRLVPLFAMLALLLMGCGDPTLSALMPQGEVADKQYSLMVLSLAIMIFVLLVVFVIYVFVIIKFRKRKGDDTIPEQVEGNHLLEILWTAIPILLLIILAVPTVMQTFDLSAKDKPKKGELALKVTGHQYWWEFEYPKEEIITSQELVLPVNTKVHVELSSADVIHSFWIPSLAGKTDTNPGDGSKNYMWIETGSKEQVYKGKCAELCGASHALMDFKVKVVSKDKYQAWVSSFKKASGKATGNAAEGQKIFEKNCLSCHAVGKEGGNTGPNLTGFGDKQRVAGVLEHDKDNVKKWIEDPQKVKPGNNMPNVPLNDEEVDAVADYLLSLKLQ